MDCGLTCLRMVAAFYGKNVSVEYLRRVADFEKTGASFFGLSKAASSLHFEAQGVMATTCQLKQILADIPVIVHWQGDHFTVLYAFENGRYVVADPAKGILKLTETEFAQFAVSQTPDASQCVNILLLEATPELLALQDGKEDRWRHFTFFWSHVKQFRTFFIYITWALALGLGIQFLMPFFTKSVVDYGIQSKSLQYVGYLLAGQLMLVLSSTFFSVVKSWITLHLSSRINYSLVAGFLAKLFQVPLRFFETRKIGDILQRIGDHSRIEMFITRVSFNIVFSVLSVILYASILAYYHFGFFVLIFSTMVIYAGWVVIFLKKRKQIDWKRFELSSKNQTHLIQLVNGIHDLKINNAEKKYYQKWSLNQHEFIKNGFDSLRLFQYQETGATLIFQLAQLSITFLSVKLVIDNSITFGTMLSIQFIIGQLIMPVQQIIGSIGSIQDARISYERLEDVWSVRNEAAYQVAASEQRSAAPHQPMQFSDVSFCYPGHSTVFALKNISFDIPEGKTTAIVGLSGSGKTSIIKLLLGYYSDYTGNILVGDVNFRELDLDIWRASCGVVMQESFIFSDTIAENICMSLPLDSERLQHAMGVANIADYVASLPLKHNTVIGSDGKGLSQGQKQRLLIARAVYKNPQYIFFDEATNALDAENENIIINNLKEFFRGRTVVLIAHRLSTIQFADKILLLENGNIIEQGNHFQLKNRNGKYHELIRKQMAG